MQRSARGARAAQERLAQARAWEGGSLRGHGSRESLRRRTACNVGVERAAGESSSSSEAGVFAVTVLGTQWLGGSTK